MSMIMNTSDSRLIAGHDHVVYTILDFAFLSDRVITLISARP